MKTVYIVLGIILTLGIVAVILLLMKKEKETISLGAGSDDEMKAMITGYDDITSLTDKELVWAHIFKTCIYYKDMVASQSLRWGRTIEEQIVVSVDHAINNNRNPSDYLKNCEKKFIDTSKESYCKNLDIKIKNMHWLFDKAAKKKAQESLDRYCKNK